MTQISQMSDPLSQDLKDRNLISASQRSSFRIVKTIHRGHFKWRLPRLVFDAHRPNPAVIIMVVRGIDFPRRKRELRIPRYAGIRIDHRAVPLRFDLKTGMAVPCKFDSVRHNISSRLR